MTRNDWSRRSTRGFAKRSDFTKRGGDMSDIIAWSCDERDRKKCRNAHGCHCREIASLMARNDAAAAEIDRLRAQLAASTEVAARWKANHKDAVQTKRGTDARLKVALAALQQIYDVCRDNRGETCNHRMALDFVDQLAGAAFDKATHNLPHKEWDSESTLAAPA